MKLVRAIVREDRVSEIARYVSDAGADGITVTSGFGRGQHTSLGVYRGVSYPVMVPVCVIDILASDEAASDLAAVVREHGCTGIHGDGHVVVLSVDEGASVRTGMRSVS